MVLIKEMESPNSCAACSLKDYNTATCSVKRKRIGTYRMTADLPRPEWCPLVEVESYGVDGLLYKERH